MENKAIIFSIEEFSINDGPGIRTTIFFKGCPLRCAWCHNPESISPETQKIIKKGKEEICGYSMLDDELVNYILRNKQIYELNHGGVTFTGGEPLFQAPFLINVLKKLNGTVHTAIETSGYASEQIFKQVVSRLNLVLFDVKQMNSDLHKKFTGVDNDVIQRNLSYLCSRDKPFIIRVPLIPGVNDTEQNMLAVLNAVKGAKALQRVEILRYNKMAGAKYQMIGKTYDPPFDTTAQPKVYNVFKENNINTIVL